MIGREITDIEHDSSAFVVGIRDNYFYPKNLLFLKKTPALLNGWIKSGSHCITQRPLALLIECNAQYGIQLDLR